MRFELEPGKYVVAVSGGVDSVVLLYMLAKLQHAVIPGEAEESPRKSRGDLSTALRFGRDDGEGASPFDVLRSTFSFTVAHFDHGIREDSAEDRKLVQQLAKEYGLPFVYQRAELGPGASEAQAREARYAFLHDMRKRSGAGAIITAHHQDDVLETIIMNLLRGTGRRGLSSLKSTDIIKRPLLHVPKKELLRYADREGLTWREDSTNTDETYLRNYIRANIMSRFAEHDRESLYILSKWAEKHNKAIAEQVSNYLHMQPSRASLDRHSFVMLPHAVAREVMGEWLLSNTGAELSRKLLERLVVSAKTGKVGTKVDVDAGHWMKIEKQTLVLHGKVESSTQPN